MTSIEFLFKELWETSKDKFEWNSILEKAKEMHKEEIIESYCNGCADITKDESIFPRETSEQYYQETFKTK
jgi:3-methyladenine DNA glycosylase AlkC